MKETTGSIKKYRICIESDGKNENYYVESEMSSEKLFFSLIEKDEVIFLTAGDCYVYIPKKEIKKLMVSEIH